MDEPTSALAVAEVEAVLALINRVKARGVSVVLITHRLQDLFRVCDRIAVMYEGTKVAERRIDETDLEDLVHLIVGEKAARMSAYTERAAGLAARTTSSPRTPSSCRSPPSSSLCVVIFAVGTDTFLTAGNILNVLRQAAPVLIVAVAMTFVITTGGIDLSVGSPVALVNAVAAILLAQGVPCLRRRRPACSRSAPLIGLVQGWFIAYRGHPGLHRHPGRPLDPARRRALADPGLLDPDHDAPGLLLARPRRSPRPAGAGAHRRARRRRRLRRPARDALRPLRRRRRRQRRGRAPRRHAVGTRSSPRSTCSPASPAPLAGLADRRPPRLGLVQRRRRLRARGDRRRRARRHRARAAAARSSAPSSAPSPSPSSATA